MTQTPRGPINAAVRRWGWSRFTAGCQQRLTQRGWITPGQEAGLRKSASLFGTIEPADEPVKAGR